ncbi:STAS domain-containing protein [Hydrogenophaga sp.]|uniref:STAS domain-containing protein n=1 Tax=Hydrogenophaga sp. TaxID=1904254 RepID=UPI0026187E60|nr:STAS domain-containing protein [Hydrogenophaga sp.]MCW5655032.1 STAS domain-containing protein [Hydrogenophaga sp.]
MPSTAVPSTVLPERLTLNEAGTTLLQLQASLQAQPAGQVLVDASPLRDFDSSALAVLLELRRHVQAGGRHLEVTGLPPRLESLATLYGVRELLASV